MARVSNSRLVVDDEELESAYEGVCDDLVVEDYVLYCVKEQTGWSIEWGEEESISSISSQRRSNGQENIRVAGSHVN